MIQSIALAMSRNRREADRLSRSEQTAFVRSVDILAGAEGQEWAENGTPQVSESLLRG